MTQQSVIRFQQLGAFAKLREAITSFITYVRMEQLDSHWTDFDQI
jgi:hypothetical protein